MKNLNLFYSGSLSILFFYLGFQILTVNAPTSQTGETLPFYEIGESQWFKMRANARLTTDQLLSKHSRDLGLGTNDRWINYRTETDAIGMTHHRFQLHHNNIPIKSAELLVHEKDGFINSFNGKWPREIQPSGTVSFSKEAATEKAIEFLPAEKYIWENPNAERLHKHAHHDHEASFYPDPELVYYNPNFNTARDEYRLVYSMIIQAEAPLFRKEIYIDASTGDLIREIDILCHTNVPAVGETKYHGTRNIVIDSIAPDSFLLIETTRGYGIETYNADLNGLGNLLDTLIRPSFNPNNDPDTVIVDVFVDYDNYWNNANANQDEVAIDAHYGAEMTFDLFDQMLDYTGVDGDSMALISIVHYGDDYQNAFWNGSWASFGDGNGVTWSPLTSLDVVGHEFTHGVTRNTAGLIYSYESGALNESFSDIFGTAVEFWGDSATADYLIAEDFVIDGNGFRNMTDPNEDQNPDTYEGSFWEFGAGDSGGVHTNSGVQNHWFYLLAEGGSGTNDNNYNFNVDSIGQQDALFIAFRNLRYYLTESSQYIDARRGSVQAADDLWGECSFQVEQTKNAWRAVGVGSLTDNNDFEMLRIVDPIGETCGLSANEFPTVELAFLGCQTPLSINDEIPLAIQVNNGDIFRDTIVLTASLVGGDTMIYTFTNPVSGLQGIGDHVLTASVEFEMDPVENNNTASTIVSNVFNQNSDFESTNVLKPLSDCFMSTGVNVQISLAFQGCDSIAAGEELNMYYTGDGTNIVNETTTLTQTYYRGDEFNYNFTTPLDLTSTLGLSDVTAWVKYPPDFVTVNDSISAKVTNPLHMKFENVITFEAGAASEDSFYLHKSEYGDGFISSLSEFSGNYGYRITGGDVLDAWNNDLLETPDAGNVWDVNEILSTKLCCCVDATAMTEVELSFDLRQRYGYFFLTYESADVHASSNLRVLIDDNQISETFIPETHIFEPWQHLVYDVSDYAGSKFEVCFEARNFTSPQTDDIGDLSQLDNILISGTHVATNEPQAAAFEMELMPNPNNGLLNIQFQMALAQDCTIEVYDVHGRLLDQGQLQSHVGQNNIRLDLNHLSQGIYFVKLSSEAGSQVESLIRL